MGCFSTGACSFGCIGSCVGSVGLVVHGCLTFSCPVSLMFLDIGVCGAGSVGNVLGNSHGGICVGHSYGNALYFSLKSGMVFGSLTNVSMCCLNNFCSALLSVAPTDILSAISFHAVANIYLLNHTGSVIKSLTIGETNAATTHHIGHRHKYHAHAAARNHHFSYNQTFLCSLVYK